MLNPFLKLAIDNWKNTPNIIKGIVNNQLSELGVISEEKKKVMEERLNICSACPENSYRKGYDLQKPEWRDRDDFHCTQCGCVLKFKTASMDENCPIGKWKAVEDKE